MQDGLGKRVDAGHVVGPQSKSDGELVTSETRDNGFGAQRVRQRDRQRLEQPIAGLVAMLVVDRFEPVDLKGNDDKVVAALPGVRAQLTGAVRKPLAIIEA